MVNGILGKKVGMSQVFKETGEVVPVTLIEAGPCFVMQKKVVETDGYNAVQIGFDAKRADRVNKPLQGHMAKADKGCFYHMKEVDCEDMETLNVGDEINVSDIFKSGDKIKVTGTSKGKGFSGTVRRHNFGGLPASHGSKIHRATGSIGCSAYPSRVIKGKRMPGQYGNIQVTVRGLEVVDVRPDENIIAVKGSIPGPNGRLVLLKK